MKSVNNLKSLKNPFKNADLIEHKEIRCSALKSLAKLYKHHLDITDSKKKVKNVFSENKDLVKLLKKENLSVDELAKVNEGIVDDFSKFQKDLDTAKKVTSLSDKKIDKHREKGSKVFFELGGMMKSQDSLKCVGNKTKEFCKKNSMKLALCGVLMTAGGLSTFINTAEDTQASVQAQASSNIIEEFQVENNKSNILEPSKVIEIKESKDNLSILSDVLNNASFSEFDKLDLESDSFNKSKNLYLSFMSDLSAKADSNGSIDLDKNTFNAFLKAEYLYYSGLKKNLEIKAGSLKGDKLKKNEGKINTANDKLKLISEQYENLEDGKKIGFSYQKHNITIDIKSDGETYEINGLNKFNY